MSMSGPVLAVIDLDAISANVAVLAAHAAPAEVLAAVKADGYGHGLVPAARAALAGGASRLGVAQLDEAMALRAAGIDAPVLAWLCTPGEAYRDAVAAGVEFGVGAPWLLAEVDRAARAVGRTARVQLAADTGMSRDGAVPADWPALVSAAATAQAAGTIEVVGVYSHLACADAPGDPSVEGQRAAFEAALRVVAAAGLRPRLRHLANSAATLTVPAARYDLVRAGIAVYGLSPIPALGDFGLRPAMTLTAAVALAKRVPAGSGVSYGLRYRTERETTLAVVPVGYADGVRRAAYDAGIEVLVAGRRRRVAGTVCMDQFVVDVGDDPVAAGDEVVLFGPGDRGEPTAAEWARRLGTISYEVVTGIGARAHRVYTGGGHPAAAGRSVGRDAGR